MPRSATCRGQHLGRLDPAVHQHLPARVAPPPARDGRAAQVHHRVGAVQRAVVDAAGRRVPAPLVRLVRRAPDEPEHLVVGGAQSVDQCGADQAGRAGDDDSHKPRSPSKLPSCRRFLIGGQEPARVRAVDQAVVVGQREVDHRPDRDRVVAVRVGDHDRPLHDQADTQDADLRRRDDRRVEQRALAAEVGQRERGAEQLVRRDLVRPRAVGEVRDLVREAGDAQVTRVVDGRGQQAALGVHRDAEVLGAVVGHLLGLVVDRRVQLRVLLERLDRGLGEERQERELHALALLERTLRARAQLGDLGHVDLEHLGELGGGLQRLDHPPRHGLAEAAHLLGLATQVRRRRGGRGRPRRGRRGRGGRLLRGLGRGEHVLLADPAADAAALEAAEVDVVLGRELAHQRRDVRAVAGGLAVVGRGGRGLGLRRGLRRLLGRRSRAPLLRGSGLGASCSGLPASAPPASAAPASRARSRSRRPRAGRRPRRSRPRPR